MKKKILALAISSVLSTSAFAGLNNILITEYVEGSSFNKAIEISNFGADDYTFDNSVSLYYSSYKNDIQREDGSSVLLDVTIPSGKSIVVIHGDADDLMRQHITRNGGESAIIVAKKEGYNSPQFNGDDAVWLGTSKEEAGIHDIFGIYGHKGDKTWADKTFRRKTSETSPSKSFDATKWDAAEKNSFSGLGDPSKVDGSPLPPPETFVCTDPTEIFAIQGDSTSSPIKGHTVTVEGIVTHVTDLPVKGLYLQAKTSDGNINTSDGIFVKTSKASKDLIGKTICLSSEVQENYGLTQLETGEWGITDASSTLSASLDI